MITSAFGQVSNLEPAINADYILDFSSGNLPPSVRGPAADIVGPRTYCDQDRMYQALRGQPRIGFDQDALRWGLRRDVGSENLVVYSNPAKDLPSPRGWGGAANGLKNTTFDAADFLLPSERCAMMDYKAESSTYIHPRGSTTATAYVAGTRYTASMFFKNLDPIGVDIRLRLHPFAFGEYQDAVYVAATGAVAGGTANAADTVIGVEAYPNGWKRLYITAMCTTTISTYPPILWPGGARQGRFLFGGFQLEALGFPTSYIPTYGGRVIRGNERGLWAEFPADFFLNVALGQAATMWADTRVATLYQPGAAGTFGLDRFAGAGAPYVGQAVTFGATDQLTIARSYITKNSTQSVTTRLNAYLRPHNSRNVHATTWTNDPVMMHETHLAARAEAVKVTDITGFPGMAPDMSTPRVLLGTLMNPDNYFMTGWIYECRLYRRPVDDDQLKQMVGIS